MEQSISERFLKVFVGNGFLRLAGLWSSKIQAKSGNLEALEAKFDNVVCKTE